MRFSLPSKRYLSRHHLPPPSARRYGFSCGLAVRMAVSVRAIGGNSCWGWVACPQYCPRISIDGSGRYRQRKRPEAFIYWACRPFLFCFGSSIGGGGGDRTRVRQHSTLGSTCLVVSIDLTRYGPSDREQKAILYFLTECPETRLSCDPMFFAPTSTAHRQAASVVGRVLSCQCVVFVVCDYVACDFD